jgi:hypothetical protein
MDCRTAREHVLESLTDPLPTAASARLAAHCDECQECAAFALEQQTLDARLARLLVAGDLGPDFRRTLLSRTVERPRQNWRELVPDVVHFVTWGAATGCGAVLLPIDPSLTLTAGFAIAIVSYFVLAIARTMFEPLPS